MMGPLIAVAMCVSPVQSFGNITVVNRLPEYCTQHLGAPPWPRSSLPAAVAPPEPVVEAVEEPPKVVEKKKAVVKKKASRQKCKKGRTRNAAGQCGRWNR